jgi:hypothetical protein
MCFLRTFDIYATVPLTLKMYGSIVADFNLTRFISSGLEPFGLTIADIGVTAVGIAVMILAGKVTARNSDLLAKPEIRVLAALALAVVILVFGVYGIGYDSRQFIYNQF